MIKHTQKSSSLHSTLTIILSIFLWSIIIQEVLEKSLFDLWKLVSIVVLFSFVEPYNKVKFVLLHTTSIKMISYFSDVPYIIWDPRKLISRLEDCWWSRGHFGSIWVIRVVKKSYSPLHMFKAWFGIFLRSLIPYEHQIKCSIRSMHVRYHFGESNPKNVYKT